MKKPRLPAPAHSPALPPAALPQVTGGLINLISNIMKTRHEAAQAALANVR